MTAQPLRIDERNHVERPLLDQLAGLGWEIVDLDHRQRPAEEAGTGVECGGKSRGREDGNRREWW